MLDSGDHLPFLADADAVLDAICRIVERADAPPAAGQKVLRALVGVAPPPPDRALEDYAPEACLELEGAVVAVFRSSDAATRCATELREQHPGVSAVVALDDTLATVEDAAVLAVAAAARAPVRETRPQGGLQVEPRPADGHNDPCASPREGPEP